ncbi:MAG: GNAT family N-acetyltransferase [bacterium]
MDDTIHATIRFATFSDLESIGRLGALLVGAHHDFDPKRFIAASSRTEQEYASLLGKQLKEPDDAIVVAEYDGKVVGFAYAGMVGPDFMSLRGPVGALYDLVVDPVHRGRGIGRLLLDAALRELTVRKAPRVLLSTAEQNDSAQRLFARAGFRPTMIEMTRELDDVSS